MSVDPEKVQISINLIEPQEGDLLHVKVGGDLEDGQGPWIPGPSELEEVRKAFDRTLPEGVRLIVTHPYVDSNLIRSAPYGTHRS